MRFISMIQQQSRRAWDIFLAATRKFFAIDGDQRAAAFAFYGFFSLFPLILIFVTVASFFVDRNRAGNAIIAYAKNFVPMNAGMRHNVFDIILGVVHARGRVGVVALAVLLWVALGFFNVVTRAVNRAWSDQIHGWWRLPLKSLLLLVVLASALVLGLILPVLTDFAERWLLPDQSWTGWLYWLAGLLMPVLVLFYGLCLFYKLAPRRDTRFAEVWPAAVVITLMIRLLELLFFIYLTNFSRYNAVYGTLGGIMALLTWIWLSGCLVIFGACLCAARVRPADRSAGGDSPEA